MSACTRDQVLVPSGSVSPRRWLSGVGFSERRGVTRLRNSTSDDRALIEAKIQPLLLLGLRAADRKTLPQRASPGGVARVSLRAVSRSRSTAEAGGPEGKSSLPNGIRARRARLGGPLTKEVTAASRTKLSDGHEAPGTQRPPPPLRERITTSKPLKNSSLTKYGCRRRPD